MNLDNSWKMIRTINPIEVSIFGQRKSKKSQVSNMVWARILAKCYFCVHCLLLIIAKNYEPWQLLEDDKNYQPNWGKVIYIYIGERGGEWYMGMCM